MKKELCVLFYETIIEECEKRGWELSTISKLSGVREKTIKSWKKSIPSDLSATKISVAFGYSPYWLTICANEKYGSNDRNVYCVTCIVNGRKYIGSSTKEPKCRWEQHLSALKFGNHPVGLMQYDFDKYGEEAFNLTVLYRNVFRLRERECMYLNDTFNPNKGYNYLDANKDDHRHSIEKLKDISDKYSIELDQLTKGRYLREIVKRTKKCAC